MGKWVWKRLPCFFAVHRDCLSARLWLGPTPPFTTISSPHPHPSPSPQPPPTSTTSTSISISVSSNNLSTFISNSIRGVGFYCLALWGREGPQKLECAINCSDGGNFPKIWLVFSLINAQLWNINYTCVRVLNLLGGHFPKFIGNNLKTASSKLLAASSPFLWDLCHCFYVSGTPAVSQPRSWSG